jgi:hypothetical protein
MQESNNLPIVCVVIFNLEMLIDRRKTGFFTKSIYFHSFISVKLIIVKIRIICVTFLSIRSLFSFVDA